MDGDTKSEPAKREEEILAFWQKNEIFEKTLSREAPKGEFVFYDGPPFATGLPHYGHILAGTIKDAIPRYKTMQGYHVPRRWGWDCHGLPLENQIEKELGLATKRDIETLGVATFNEAARKAVLRYSDDWKAIIPRFGRWVDMENDYRTMDATYTESVWWAFNDLHKKGLVYEGFKAMHLCPRCGTTLSNFEVAQGYKDITDISVTVKLELVDEPGTFLLAWTTTPWTLPGNMAAAVNAEFTYVKISAGNEKYILAKERLEVIKVDYKIEKEFLGSELVGKSYKPPFSYFADHNIKGKEKAWKVYHAPYVTMDSGTGLVHLAPAFGAEDLELAQKEGIPIVHHVDKDGFFVDAVLDFKGLQAKPKDDPQSTDVAVIKYLAGKGLLFAKEKIIHSYPHCWRCDTPLLNYASSSWFVEVTKFKDKLVAENKKINWVPKEVGDKRFGNWLLNARDWAISRARYWGAPIPVWRNHKTKENIFIGSLDELKSHTKKSGNRYFAMRHGESEKNVKKIISYKPDDGISLTEYGKAEAKKSAQNLGTHIDIIIHSELLRATQTAEIAREVLGLDVSAMSTDSRLNEYNHGVFNGRLDREWAEHFKDIAPLFEKGPEEGESINDMRRRVGALLYECEHKYAGKNILFVSHGWPVAALTAVSKGSTAKEAVSILADHAMLAPAEIVSLPFTPIPHNENYELDYHRPYIDEVVLIDSDGTRLERVHDVFDCWFESGSMSYAQNHYPFENLSTFNPKPGWLKKSRGYPADFIAEGLDQTRGWFYSLLVLGVGLFGKATYKNVIVNGIVLAEDGQKMSKRLKNYPDPLTVLEKYGADAIRYYLLASPLMKAEDLNFSEKGVGEVASKLIGRFLNVVSFYELYKDLEHGVSPSSHPLDRWIFSRLNQVIGEVERGMESYELDKATRPLTLFVDDLSTWYLRRSRDRFKEEEADARDALQTLRSVIEIFAKISAPFMPFVAESAYQRVKIKDMPESVHLCEWPRTGSTDAPLQEAMVEVRRIASRGLEARQKVDIKVRQPLAKITVNSELLAGRVELLQLIKDELNVKEVVIDGALSKDEVILDTDISDELKEEGNVREVIRFIQELRKEAGLTPKEAATLVFVQSDDIEKFLEKHWHTLSTATRLSSRESGNGTNELVFDGMTFRFNVRS
ncbi:MAG: class I tRNA ligase family protein [Candidatus Pacebacteria bacterium]|nr:class I tRNA ligase family protein [Candidatus Paceibacterota bacterium]MBP9832266.1 class I tRNA ligase family protein [Candidatus Paceibacterota bacterium]